MIANQPAAGEIKQKQCYRCLEALLKEFGDVVLLECLAEVFQNQPLSEEDPARLLRAASACAREAQMNDRPEITQTKEPGFHSEMRLRTQQ